MQELKKTENGQEICFRKITENFPKLRKQTDIQIQVTQIVTNKIKKDLYNDTLKLKCKKFKAGEHLKSKRKTICYRQRNPYKK